jgi:VWFA-related protein
MVRKCGGWLLLAGMLLLAGAGWAQQKPDEIPDAPSATRPVPPPEPRSQRPGTEDSTPAAAPDEESSSEATKGTVPASSELPHSTPPTSDQPPAPPKMPPIVTVPEGSVPRDSETHEDLYKISTTVNLVLVPVNVKDSNGRQVNGLLYKDFSVLENGQKQQLKFFTSDPFPLSVAVLFDLGMPDIGVKRVQETLPALQGAFSQYDEVAIYTYSSTVSQVADFGSAGQRLTTVLNQIKNYNGANNGPPVTSGPLGPQGPIINGAPIDSPVTPVITPPKESRVTNDAILRAARDLSKRARTRRKVIFVVSDGRERGSVASYADTLKVLLTQNIIVYAVGIDGAALPGYSRLQKVHLPGLGLGKLGFEPIGYGNILSKYTWATGGGTVYAESARAGIEEAYNRAIGEARNQYTLGYTPKAGIGGYRQIEVRVRRPDVKVYAKDGYYPLPTAR